MNKKKRPLLLLETMLSLTLFALILGYCFYRIAFTARWTGKLEKASEKILDRLYIEQRLGQVLHGLQSLGEEKTPNCLTWTTDIPLDPDLSFMGTVHAELKIEHGDLLLTVWPVNSSKERGRSEILRTGVSHLGFQFYQLDKGHYEVSSIWEGTAPPDHLVIDIDGMRVPYQLKREVYTLFFR